MNKVVSLHPAPQAIYTGPRNPHFSYVDNRFDASYEAAVRSLTRDPDLIKERRCLPQDKLVYAFVTVNRTTGIASEFGWASGRKDVHIIADMPTADVSAVVVEARRELINKLEEKYHDRGYCHDEYKGGFREFAQNFERSTGRRCAPEISALCERELRPALQGLSG